MFEPLADLLHAHLSRDWALRHASAINRFERQYSYDNFRRSAGYCAVALRKIGAADVLKVAHPADGVSTYMDCVMPMAWDVKGARLELLSPTGGEATVLSDWKTDPFTIALWSPPTSPGGDEAELVLEEDMRRGVDVRGKIVLNAIVHHPRMIKKLVAERGGIGVVSDWTENYLDTPDGIYWNNEWSQTPGWYGGTREDIEQSNIWCLSITPRTGLMLRKLLAVPTNPIRLRADIRTRLYRGESQTITALIPGTTKRAGEVLLLAHLYEPMFGDNAAGAGAAIELIRTIKSLVDAGEIRRPKRTIRILLSRERYGFAAYLATNPQVRKSAVAAINLDDICTRQELGGEAVCVWLNPHAAPSFTDVLFTDVARYCYRKLAPHLNWETRRNASTDDAFITDPTIGIPTNWLMALSLKHHHNSINTFDCLDPGMLHVHMTISATTALFIAAAGMGEAEWLRSRVMKTDRGAIRAKSLASLAKLNSSPRPPVASVSKRRATDFRKLDGVARVAANMIPTRKTLGLPVNYVNVPPGERERVLNCAEPKALLWAAASAIFSRSHSLWKAKQNDRLI